MDLCDSYGQGPAPEVLAADPFEAATRDGAPAQTSRVARSPLPGPDRVRGYKLRRIATTLSGEGEV